jgi:hypothetical protein
MIAITVLLIVLIAMVMIKVATVMLILSHIFLPCNVNTPDRPWLSNSGSIRSGVHSSSI